MPINLASLFQGSRDAVAAHAGSYGLPTIKTLVVGDRTSGFSWLQICPDPSIDLVSPTFRTQYQDFSDVEVELDDIQVSGISKVYTRDQIAGRGKFYVVGLTAQQCQSLVHERFDQELLESFGAIVCDLVPETEVEEQHQLHWNLILRRRQRS
ncbi:MAG: hypothetical protein AAGB19_17875 [Cyanobacteria bacterium P01_F01_bin.3]